MKERQTCQLSVRTDQARRTGRTKGEWMNTPVNAPMNTPRKGWLNACQEIADGKAVASALWTLLSKESDRAGYALRPDPWEGPGEYQHLERPNLTGCFVRLPDFRPLPTSPAQARTVLAQAARSAS